MNMCNLKKDDNYCELKEWFTAMEARQKSFEARQAKNELSISETRRYVTEIKKDLSEYKTEHKYLNERINVNTKQLTEIRSDMQPVIEGVHAIQESVKVLGWITKGVKWVSVTVVGTGAAIYAWVEYISHLGKH